MHEHRDEFTRPEDTAGPTGVHCAAAVPTTKGGMPAEVLTAALALSLWLACGSFVLAIVDGLGANPIRRFAIGLLLVVLCAGALIARARVCAWLNSRPWLVVPAAIAVLGVIAIEGVVGTPYAAVSLTPIGVAVVVARARTVWLCVAVLIAGYAFAVLPSRSPAELSDAGQLGTVVGALVGYPVTAILLLGLRRRFVRFVDHLEPTLQAIRNGAPASNLALQHALAGEPLALPAGPPAAALTPTERRVVEGLAGGMTPKQLAFEWGVSINTVRSHISSAKRKTDARTLRELAGIVGPPARVEADVLER